MYEHKPERPHYFLLLSVIGAHLALFAYALQPARPLLAAARSESRARHDPAAALAPSAAAASRRTEATAAAVPHDTPPEAAVADDDPRHAFSAQQWHDNQLAAQAQRQRRALADLSALADTQPATAMQRLRQRLQAGDAVAAEAAQALQDECSTPLPRLAETAPAALAQLDDATSQAVGALKKAQGELLAARERRCKAWRDQQAELAQALQSYQPHDAAAAQLQALQREFALPQPPPGLFDRLLEHLRGLWQSNKGENVPLSLAGELLAAPEPSRRELGLQLLEQVAEENDRYAALVADFLRRSDGQQLAPAREPRWTERAAALGDNASLDALLARPHRADAATQDWSWHAYGVWFAAYGCQPVAYSAERLQRDLAALQQLDRQLGPAERSEAGRLYRERVATWGTRARALHDCGD